jgi:hypothetical protein
MKRRPLQTVAAMTGMAALTDNRFLGRLRERRWRRVLVLLVTGFWLLTVAAMTKPVRLEAGWAWTAAAALTVLTWIALTLATRNVSNSIDAFADERDRAVRDRAHRLAYWIIGAPIGALVGALFGYLAGAVEDGGVVTLSASDLWAFGPVIFSILVLYAALPPAIIGWTEPDAPAEEFDDEALADPLRSRSLY